MLLFAGCIGQREIPLVEDVEIDGWSRAAVLTLENRDTTQRRDISLFLRFVPNFLSARSVTLRVVTTAPDHTMIAERVTLPLEAEEESRGGEMTYRSYPYRSRVLLSQSGEYSFAIYPLEQIKGVTAVGIDFE